MPIRAMKLSSTRQISSASSAPTPAEGSDDGQVLHRLHVQRDAFD